MSDADRPSDDQEPTRLGDNELPETGARQRETPALQRLGDFELIREIGRGGMGVVYDARQVSLNRRVALKVLPPTIGLTQPARQRFEREARAAAKLHHSNIVPVHAIGEDEGHHFYAMDLIEGQSLDQVLRQLMDEGSNPLLAETVTKAASELPKHPQPPPESTPISTSAADSVASLGETAAGSRTWFDAVAKLIAEVADALDYAHRRGVIHRDIKPANLMLSGDGRLCVTDFGLARIVQEPGMTVSGSFLGTPAYMSPEQIAAGRVKLDHRTDIYSLGAVLYELLTLQRPFVGESREEVLSAIMVKDPRSPRKLNAKIPLDLETICLKAMERDPDRRYPAAGELAKDLRLYLHGGLIAARRAGVLRRSWKMIRRHPTATVSILAIVVASATSLLAWNALSGKAKADVARLVSEARLMLERGEYRLGLENAERAVALDPANQQARLVRARMLLQRVHRREAAEEARQVLQDDPDNWEAHLILARVAEWDPRIDRQAHLAAVEGRVPGTADAFYLLGLAAESSREAIEWLDRALELNPAHALALFERGDRYIRVRNYTAAMADAERLLAARPRSAQGLRRTGFILWNMHDMEGALEMYDRTIDLDPEDPANWLQRGAEQAYRGRAESGVEDLTHVIELDPDRAIAYAFRAISYSRIGDYQRAIEDCRRALELEPDNSQAFETLAWAYWQSGQREQARATVEALNTRTEGWHSKRLVVQARIRIADFHQRIGDYARVYVEAEKIIELLPDELWGYKLRALALHEIEGESAISRDCDLMVGLMLDQPIPLLERGNVMRDLCHSNQQALADYGQAIGMAPSWSDAYYERALLYEADQDLERALANLEKAAELTPKWTAATDNVVRLRTRLDEGR